MCRNGPVSSSRTGSTPKTRVYQASLTDRSVTVTATCEMAGMVPEMATMIFLCSLWRCLRPQRYGAGLPWNFRGTSPRRRSPGEGAGRQRDDGLEGGQPPEEREGKPGRHPQQAAPAPVPDGQRDRTADGIEQEERGDVLPVRRMGEHEFEHEDGGHQAGRQEEPGKAAPHRPEPHAWAANPLRIGTCLA